MCVKHSVSEDPPHFFLDTDKVRADSIIQDDLFWAILKDDKEKLLSTIQQNKSLFKHKGQEILADACFSSAFKCAQALVKGETGLVVDINGHAKEMFPIHYAARSRRPYTTELLLYNGAQADVRSNVQSDYLDTNSGLYLPLYHPLCSVSRDVSFEELTPDYSIFKLLTLVCLPRFQDYLETVGLLAWNTKGKELEKEILQYARNGQLVHIAALLAVSHKKISDHMETVLERLVSLDNDVMTSTIKAAILLLFDVFMRVGDEIEAYVKQEKFGVTIQETSNEVARLLQEAGFAVKSADTDLTHCSWFHRGDTYQTEWRCTSDDDLHMPHYGRSGCRWRCYDNSIKPCQISGRVVDRHNFYGKIDKVRSVEERLNQALLKDDKNEFLSTIHQNKSLVLLKGQEILEKVCEYRALVCGATLLKGETPVIVGINGRTPDRMFPIHHAAKSCHPSMTELFLYYGARADARADVHSVYQPLPRITTRASSDPSLRGRLPLYLTLHKMSYDEAIKPWACDINDEYPAFQLLSAICLPRFQNHLETIDLLAWSTKDIEIEQEFLQCAKDGEIQHMAALLAVAHKKLTNPIESIPKLVFTCDSYAKILEGKKKTMLLLLEVFSRAGDAIEAYIKQGKVGVTIEQTCEEVACLLQEAGFTLENKDTDLTCYFWSHHGQRNKREWRWKPEDSGMPHYGATGCRWMAYGRQSNPRLILGNKVVDQQNRGVKCFHSQIGAKAITKDKLKRIALCSSLVTPFQTGVLAKIMGKVARELACFGTLWNVSPDMPRALLLSTGRRMIVK